MSREFQTLAELQEALSAIRASTGEQPKVVSRVERMPLRRGEGGTLEPWYRVVPPFRIEEPSREPPTREALTAALGVAEERKRQPKPKPAPLPRRQARSVFWNPATEEVDYPDA